MDTNPYALREDAEALALDAEAWAPNEADPEVGAWFLAVAATLRALAALPPQDEVREAALLEALRACPRLPDKGIYDRYDDGYVQGLMDCAKAISALRAATARAEGG